jgi:30S ribosomal protein 3
MTKYVLSFIWVGNTTIGVCLNEKSLNKEIPISKYYFWPRLDAWEEMQNLLKNKSYIPTTYHVNLLNKLTEVINFWQDNNNFEEINVEIIQSKFPECKFLLLPNKNK